MNAISPTSIEDRTQTGRGLDGFLDIENSSGQVGINQPLSLETSVHLGILQSWYDFRSSLPMLLLDWIGTILAIAAAATTHQVLGSDSSLSLFSLAIMLPSIVLFFQYMHGLYPACGMIYSIEFRRTLRSCVMFLTGMAAVLCVCDPVSGATGIASPETVLSYGVFSIVLIIVLCGTRPGLRKLLANQDWWTQPALILGQQENAIRLFERMNKARHEGIRPCGILFDSAEHWGDRNFKTGAEFLGPISEMETALLQTSATRLLVTDQSALSACDLRDFDRIPNVVLPIDFCARPTERTRIAERDGRMEAHCQSLLMSPTARVLKRTVDLGLIVLASPVWLSVMVLIFICIKWLDPGPLFYRQSRVGRFGQSFSAFKFRSMVCNADQRLREYLTENPVKAAEWERTHKLRDDPRITRFGAFLRRTSLDELPQIFNVLRGDMSLVGPRPIIDCNDYDKTYIDEHPEVFDLYKMVQPGITGLWQISGRNDLPYQKRVELDRFYLQNWSVAFDIFILWRTIKTALFREGAY